MITRRQLARLMAGSSVFAAASIWLAACTQQPAGGNTLQWIVDEIQKGCGFLTTWQDVAAVLVSLAITATGAGAAATVAVDAAKKVKDMICAAVPSHPATATSALREATSVAGQVITVHVNGVPVRGTLTAKHP